MDGSGNNIGGLVVPLLTILFISMIFSSRNIKPFCECEPREFCELSTSRSVNTSPNCDGPSLAAADSVYEIPVPLPSLSVFEFVICTKQMQNQTNPTFNGVFANSECKDVP